MNNPIKAVGNKMIKNKGDDMGRIEDMGVILKEKKIHERKTPKEQHKTQK
jgi:sporulation protein YlmC with PRC-barrel domain